MTEELKPLPCPFCGDVPVVWEAVSNDSGERYVHKNIECQNRLCGARPFVSSPALPQTLAVWNTRSPAWRDDMENVPDSDKRVMFWRSKLKRVIICRADDYWARPRPHWFDDVTHWQLPLPPEEAK